MAVTSSSPLRQAGHDCQISPQNFEIISLIKSCFRKWLGLHARVTVLIRSLYVLKCSKESICQYQTRVVFYQIIPWCTCLFLISLNVCFSNFTFFGVKKIPCNTYMKWIVSLKSEYTIASKTQVSSSDIITSHCGYYSWCEVWKVFFYLHGGARPLWDLKNFISFFSMF